MLFAKNPHRERIVKHQWLGIVQLMRGPTQSYAQSRPRWVHFMQC